MRDSLENLFGCELTSHQTKKKKICHFCMEQETVLINNKI